MVPVAVAAGGRQRQSSGRREIADGRHGLSLARARQADVREVGDKVTAGQTLLIIEAMKTFNPIKAAKAGTVTQILIEDGAAGRIRRALMIVE